jgi:hypothetical protein
LVFSNVSLLIFIIINLYTFAVLNITNILAEEASM